MQQADRHVLLVLPGLLRHHRVLRNAPDWVADWKGAPADSEAADRRGARTHRMVEEPRPRPRGSSSSSPTRWTSTRSNSRCGRCAARSTCSFGWGTNLTNDFVGCAPAGVDGQLKAICSSARWWRRTVRRRSSSPTIRTRSWGRPTRSSATGGSWPGRHEGRTCGSLVGRFCHTRESGYPGLGHGASGFPRPRE